MRYFSSNRMKAGMVTADKAIAGARAEPAEKESKYKSMLRTFAECAPVPMIGIGVTGLAYAALLAYITTNKYYPLVQNEYHALTAAVPVIGTTGAVEGAALILGGSYLLLRNGVQKSRQRRTAQGL